MKQRTFVWAAGILFASWACGITPSPAAPSQPGLETIVAETMQALTASTPAQAAGAGGIPITLQNISFVIPNGLASGAINETSVEVEFPYVNPSMGDMPEHAKIDFQNYRLQNTFFSPRLMIFKAAEYAGYDDLTAAIISDLTAYNNSSPAAETLLLQMLSARIQAISFVNGKGIRLLTQASGFPAPINNSELFYYYQGLTNDGRYFMQAILPVSAPFLASGNTPETAVFPVDAIPFDWENPESHASYYEAVTQQINGASADIFLPSINDLDGLIQSVEIRP